MLNTIKKRNRYINNINKRTRKTKKNLVISISFNNDLLDLNKTLSS